MYLANIIAGETYCVLNCDYCMYTKKNKKDLSKDELSIVSWNIWKLKNFIDNSAKKLQIISLTWWEPAIFPDIIRNFYESFDDKLIRICTNWIITDRIWLDNYSPERIYFAISLDWIDLEDNVFRFKSQAILDKILSNIDAILTKWFSLEILTVLSPQNILKYMKMIWYFEEKYMEYIKNWQLWFIPFELVNYMNLDKFNITEEMSQAFVEQINSNIEKSTVLSMYKEYFHQLTSFYLWNRVNTCGMYKWGLYLKYLWDSIWTRGSFNVYWCWSRGHLMMGTMNFNDKYDEAFILERRETKSVDEYFKESACKRCFDNRHFYWMMLNDKYVKAPYILQETLDLYRS